MWPQRLKIPSSAASQTQDLIDLMKHVWTVFVRAWFSPLSWKSLLESLTVLSSYCCISVYRSFCVVILCQLALQQNKSSRFKNGFIQESHIDWSLLYWWWGGNGSSPQQPGKAGASGSAYWKHRIIHRQALVTKKRPRELCAVLDEAVEIANLL